jgi:hypothetical protein
MRGLAPDDAAERDVAVEIRHPVRKRDGGRDLERTRHLDHLPRRAGLRERGRGACDQVVGDLAVVGRHDDQHLHRIGEGG